MYVYVLALFCTYSKCFLFRPLGRPRSQWEGSTYLNTKEIRYEVWIEFVWLEIGTGGWLLWIQ